MNAFRHSRVAAIVVIGAIVFAVVQFVGERHAAVSKTGTPVSVLEQLGPVQPSAGLVHRPNKGLKVSIQKGGFGLSTSDGAVGLVSTTATKGGAWTKHTNGATRATPFGSETVAVTPSGAEQYLTVRKQQGERTWRWQLVTKFDVRETPKGWVGFFNGMKMVQIGIAPVKILDATGKDVTPKGLHWSTTRTGGKWWLELTLDDKALPLPYTIDPQEVFFRVTGAIGANNVAATSLSVPIPTTVRAHDLMLLHVALVSTTAPTTPAGWTVVTNTSTTNTSIEQVVYWKTSTGSDGPSVAVTTPSAVSVGSVDVYRGVDTSSGTTATIIPVTSTSQTGGTSTTIVCPTATTTSTFQHIVCMAAKATPGTGTWPASGAYNGTGATAMTKRSSGTASTTITLAGYDGDQAVAAATGTMTLAGVSQASQRGISNTFGLLSDGTAPASGSLTMGSPTHAYQLSAGSTIYFNGNASGSFTVSDVGVTDPQSSVDSVDYPNVATTGWTHSDDLNTTSPNYTSTYLWTYGGTAIAAPIAAERLLTETNGAGLKTQPTVPIVQDISVPTGGALTVNGTAASSGGTSSYLTSGTTVTINTRTDYSADTGSGLASSALTMATAGLSGGVCGSFGTPTTIVGSPAQNVADGNCYLFTLTGTDNVGNAASLSTTVKVDETAPTLTPLTVTRGTNSNYQYFNSGTNTYYYNPAVNGDFTVSDAPADGGSGVASNVFPGVGWDQIKASNPVLYWRLGDTSGTTATDSSSAANNPGTYTGGYTLGQTGAITGDTDKAVLLNGTTGYVQNAAPKNLPTGASARSVEVWFKTTSATQQNLFSYGSLANGNEFSLFIKTATTFFAWGYGTTADKTFTAPSAFNDGNWHQVVETYDGTNITVYLDGTSLGSQADALTTSLAACTTGAGSCFTAGFATPSGDTNSGWYFNGTLDEVAVFPTALSAATISAQYAARTAAIGITAGAVTKTASAWTSLTHSFTSAASAASAPLAEKITVFDSAGNSAQATLNFVKDMTLPTGGAISVPAFSSTLGSIPLTVTNYTDAGSGIASNTITRSNPQAPSLPGVCPATGYSGSNAASNPDTVPTDGQCYQYTLTGTDNVNNVATVTTSNAILVDTTVPSTPTVTFSGLSANAWDNGAGTLFFRPSAGGTFTVNAASTDTQSGIQAGNAGYTFGNLNTNGGTNFGTTQTAGALAVTFDATTTGPTTARTVNSTNSAGLNSAAANYTITQDSTLPTGGVVSVPAFSATLNNITITTTNYTDAGSGIASNGITRSNPQAPSSPGVCPAGGYTGSTVVTSPDTVPTDGQCYQYTLTGTDHVGNTHTTPSSPILVDTTVPSTADRRLQRLLQHLRGRQHLVLPALRQRHLHRQRRLHRQPVRHRRLHLPRPRRRRLVAGQRRLHLHRRSHHPERLGHRHQQRRRHQHGHQLHRPIRLHRTHRRRTHHQRHRSHPRRHQQLPPTPAPSASAPAPTTTPTPAPAALLHTDRRHRHPDRKRLRRLRRRATIVGSPAQTRPPACYLYTLTGIDHVGNNASQHQTVVKVDTSAPSAPTGFSFSSPHPRLLARRRLDRLLPGRRQRRLHRHRQRLHRQRLRHRRLHLRRHRPRQRLGNANGTYTFTAASATGTGSVTAQNNAGLASTATNFTAQSDSTAPTSSITCNSAACSAGWYTTSPVSIALTGSDAGLRRRSASSTPPTAPPPAINGSDVVTNGTAVAGNHRQLQHHHPRHHHRQMDRRRQRRQHQQQSAHKQSNSTPPRRRRRPGSASAQPDPRLLARRRHRPSTSRAAAAAASPSPPAAPPTASPASPATPTARSPPAAAGPTPPAPTPSPQAPPPAPARSPPKTTPASPAPPPASPPNPTTPPRPARSPATAPPARPAGTPPAPSRSHAPAATQRSDVAAHRLHHQRHHPRHQRLRRRHQRHRSRRRHRQLQHHHPRHHHRQMDRRRQRRQHQPQSAHRRQTRHQPRRRRRPGSPSPARPTPTTPAPAPPSTSRAAAAGGFTVTASGSTDSDSGLAGYTYARSPPRQRLGATPPASTPSPQAPPPAAARSPPKTTPASPAPAPASPPNPTTPPRPARSPATAPACSAGWYTTSPVSIALTGSDAAIQRRAHRLHHRRHHPRHQRLRRRHQRHRSRQAQPPASTSPPSAPTPSNGSSKTTSATSAPVSTTDSQTRHQPAVGADRVHLHQPEPTPTTPAPAPPSTSRAAAAAASPPPPAAPPTATPASPATPTARSPPAAAGQRHRRLHLHRKRRNRQRRGHRPKQRRPQQHRHQLHRPIRQHRPDQRRLTMQRPSATGGGTTSYTHQRHQLPITTRTDYTRHNRNRLGPRHSTLTMATGTRRNNGTQSHGAPATIVGTTTQTAPATTAQVRPHRHRHVGNGSQHHHHSQGRHHRADRTDRLQLQRPQRQRLLARRRLGHLLQGRHQRRLHRHRQRLHRPRDRHHLLQLRRHRRQRLGRHRHLHLHRRLPHRHRRSHRHNDAGTHRHRHQLHRPIRHHRPHRRRTHLQRPERRSAGWYTTGYRLDRTSGTTLDPTPSAPTTPPDRDHPRHQRLRRRHQRHCSSTAHPPPVGTTTHRHQHRQIAHRRQRRQHHQQSPPTVKVDTTAPSAPTGSRSPTRPGAPTTRARARIVYFTPRQQPAASPSPRALHGQRDRRHRLHLRRDRPRPPAGPTPPARTRTPQAPQPAAPSVTAQTTPASPAPPPRGQPSPTPPHPPARSPATAPPLRPAGTPASLTSGTTLPITDAPTTPPHRLRSTPPPSSPWPSRHRRRHQRHRSRTRHRHRQPHPNRRHGNCYRKSSSPTTTSATAATVSTQTVKVDTTAPTAPTGFSFSARPARLLARLRHRSSSSGAAPRGGFTATATGSTDAETGIACYTYGAIALGSGWVERRRRLHLHRRLRHRHRRGHRHQRRRHSPAPPPTSPPNPTPPHRPARSPRASAPPARPSGPPTQPPSLSRSTGSDAAPPALAAQRQHHHRHQASPSSPASDAATYGTDNQRNITRRLRHVPTIGLCYRSHGSPAPTTSATQRQSARTQSIVDTTAPTANATPLTFSSLLNAYWDNTRLFIRPVDGSHYTVTAGFTDNESGIATYSDATRHTRHPRLHPTRKPGRLLLHLPLRPHRHRRRHRLDHSHKQRRQHLRSLQLRRRRRHHRTHRRQPHHRQPVQLFTDGQPQRHRPLRRNRHPHRFRPARKRRQHVDAHPGRPLGPRQLRRNRLRQPHHHQRQRDRDRHDQRHRPPRRPVLPVHPHRHRQSRQHRHLPGHRPRRHHRTHRPTLSYAAFTNAYAAGTTVYFQGGAAGGFTVTPSSTDNESGVSGYTFPGLGGGAWSQTNGVYTFTSAATTQTGSVTATNNAGLISTGTNFTAQIDSTAPTGGAFTANGIAAAGVGSSSYLNGTTLTINSRTDYTDTGSGLASSTLTIKSATLTNNTCGSYGSTTTITGTTSQTVASGNCYLLTLTGTDNVGNTANIKRPSRSTPPPRRRRRRSPSAR